ncbi:CoA-binding protein [Mongoliitalea lutea]|uniref:CoA-binding protein n=1 Tax=Mongoliitalea lutea TaxID=849756 RepID=A0A8J3G3Z2_9BACT|nr:CoA-binding protein [Mongoliitalea lutea]GHB23612.1 CoA-binding protein [Mongoliitalea lutea]
MKKTVIIGATPNPSRYAYVVAEMLHERKIPFVPVGIKSGTVFGEEILNLREKPSITDVHTVTLYVGPDNQKEWYDYIISLKPQRIVFNPGTENPELMNLAKAAGVDVWPACNLVLLSTGQF